MSNQNYTLEIVSHHPTFKNKSLRKYYVDGIDTVGAWGDEPFEIVFKNHTWQKVQVKLSVDGTDIFSGKLADTTDTKNMWAVSGYGTLSIKAWPETNNGGAQLVFTSGSNSVAVHTHGDLSNRGIIAAAVFTEGHVEPIKINPPVVVHHHHYDNIRRNIQPYFIGTRIGDVSYSSNTISSRGTSVNSNTIMSGDIGGTFSLNSVESATKNLESFAAVGAGDHVDQKISYVAGLIKPVFSETTRVKYMWWDELVAKLKENNVPMSHPSGFPGDKDQTNINLGTTPRIGSFRRAFPREEAPTVPVQSYLRV